ncbi:DNA replication licensing factor MCM2 [Nematocida minor]|uniref:DNA replication licensing factor MCM2 n=1 Tax=Nematocida minor TaxID=1912983 RepID=UPI00221F56B6|nr:DNA replication licensing factor MCM2 [Nematocida minor]KAI5189711.1 DNA replication licensing factor MCM2 [Nematocida minor]
MNRDADSDTYGSSSDVDRIELEDSELDPAGDDLFNDNYSNDYADNPLLDRYETEDEEYAPPLTRKELESAEREISQALGIESEEEEHWNKEPSDPETDEEPLSSFSLLQKHIHTPDVQQKVKNETVKFLKTNSNGKYIELINQMASLNKQSIYVDYFDLEGFSPVIALAAVSMPARTLPLLNESLQSVVRNIFPKYSFIRPSLILRLVNIPSYDRIRSLRNSHLGTLVKVHGIITKRSAVRPIVSLVKYTCQKCKAILGPFLIEDSDASGKSKNRPNRCLECQSANTLAVNQTETIYRDYQKVTMQEVPGTVPPGRLPRSKEVVLQYDLIDCVRPGDEIELTGTYGNTYSVSHSSKNTGVPSFSTCIEALSIIKKEDVSSVVNITPQDEKEIRRLSKLENIHNIIIQSIAPSIHGHYPAKRAMALSVFGGVPKHSSNNHKVRGDINVLLLGDPGMAKSQLLKYIQSISHRAVFATGQGASAVGLTAMVRKDPVSKEWTLEGGALVLADKGVCLIDEFDKMKDTDRVSIHEAMEQQSISISKAGIVTSLQARCAVIAAANPVRGRYNPAYTFQQNVNLSDPIISRFDVICVIQDEPGNREKDRQLAGFIVDSHRRAANNSTEESANNYYTGDSNKSGRSSTEESTGADGLIPQHILRKYIAYARERVRPKIEVFDSERISSLYASLRKESAAARGIPITVRHVESMVRIAEASARMHLREVVTQKDIDTAVEVVLDSFCSTQKNAVRNQLQWKFKKYLPAKGDSSAAVIDLINSLLARGENTPNEGATLSVKALRSKATALGIVHKNIFHTNEFNNEFKLTECGNYIIRK